MKSVKVWNGVEAINGIPAERILAEREDLANALGDIFLVMQGNQVLQIEIGSIIRAIYEFDEEMPIQEVAEAYLARHEEEKALAAQEQITVDELQEEVALLSYDNMMIKNQLNGGAAVAMLLEDEEIESPKFKMVNKWYKKGFWNEDMVRDAAMVGWITQVECDKILNN